MLASGVKRTQAVPWLAKHDLAYYGPFRYAPTPLVVTSAGSNREKGSTLGKMAREPPRAPPASGIVQTARGSTARDAPSGERRAVPPVSPGATANAPGVDGPSHVVGTPHFRSRDPTLAEAGLSGFGRFFASAFFPIVFFSRDARRLARSSHPSPLALLARPPSFQLSSPGITSVRS